MKTATAKKRPSDLPTKWLRAPDGQRIAVKVVQSDSDTLEADILAAFQSNVRRVRAEQRKQAAVAAVASKG